MKNISSAPKNSSPRGGTEVGRWGKFIPSHPSLSPMGRDCASGKGLQSRRSTISWYGWASSLITDNMGNVVYSDILPLFQHDDFQNHLRRIFQCFLNSSFSHCKWLKLLGGAHHMIYIQLWELDQMTIHIEMYSLIPDDAAIQRHVWVRRRTEGEKPLGFETSLSSCLQVSQSPIKIVKGNNNRGYSRKMLVGH